MDPDTAISHSSRPKFSWDPHNAPWTDGTGIQEKYAKYVQLWNDYYNILLDTNPHKIFRSACGVILKSQLFGRAKILCDVIDHTILRSEDRMAEIAGKTYKGDALSICNEAFTDFTSLLSTKRSNTDIFPSFQLRFNASVTMLNSNCSAVAIPETLTAWLLVHN